MDSFAIYVYGHSLCPFEVYFLVLKTYSKKQDSEGYNARASVANESYLRPPVERRQRPFSHVKGAQMCEISIFDRSFDVLFIHFFYGRKRRKK